MCDGDWGMRNEKWGMWNVKWGMGNVGWGRMPQQHAACRMWNGCVSLALSSQSVFTFPWCDLGI